MQTRSVPRVPSYTHNCSQPHQRRGSQNLGLWEGQGARGVLQFVVEGSRCGVIQSSLAETAEFDFPIAWPKRPRSRYLARQSHRLLCVEYCRSRSAQSWHLWSVDTLATRSVPSMMLEQYFVLAHSGLRLSISVTLGA